MTDRVYYRDAYAREFKARVLDRGLNGTRVTLDSTAFYPTSGGQPFDTGTLNDVRVVDVVDEGDHVVHVLSAAIAADDVTGRIDWPRRYDHMQQHTGQHVLSAVFDDLFGFATASVHFGADSSSVDLETPSLSRDQLIAAEEGANAIVFGNHPVIVSFEDAASVQGLRKAPPREGELRVVTIEGVDRSACGGTHLRSTGEIGLILLRKQDRMHGNARIEFICGRRAMRRARADYEALTSATTALGVAPDELAGRATALVAELKESDRVRRKVSEELAAVRAVDLYQKSQPDAKGVRWIVERIAVGSLEDLRALAHAAMAKERVAFVGALANPPQILFSASEDTGIDAGKTLKAALATAGGRGGGSARVAQGSVPAGGIESVVQALVAG